MAFSCIILLLLNSCKTTKNEQTKPTIIEHKIIERIVDYSFDVRGLGTIKPILEYDFNNVHSKLNIIEFDAEVNKKKKDSVKASYNQATNEFRVSYRTEPDTLLNSEIIKTETIEVIKNTTNWYLVGLGILALILLIIFLIRIIKI